MEEKLGGDASEASASAEVVSTDNIKPIRQRLVVCLDGSWNKRGSGTNIYHISNLVRKGRVTDSDGKKCRQRVYYDEGVGTGVLDKISGGAFGVGVSENVRQAYDWLVEKYNDGDELYVFGFSRGAFTARSLVGLIAKCGLVFRGAPIPQEQLWEGYRKLGSKAEWRNDNSADNWAQRVENGDVRFRPLKFLRKDDWPKAAPVPSEKPANQTERLLKDWSRRIPIKCLGVFDSVGTFGVEAVAIPWLQERRAQFHDTELSSCVLNAFQALGIDEHRANFSHIPFRRALEDNSAEGKGRAGRIEQRWFVGAHSNIGGGYPDDTLAQFPLKWMMDQCECEDLGLQFVKVKPEQPKLDPAAQACIPLHRPKVKGTLIRGNVGDSFSEFMGEIWRCALRNKRNYRWIAPPPEYQNGRAVQSYEEVHPSVQELVDKDKDKEFGAPAYEPPNLWAYWQKSPNPEDRKRLVTEPKHDYLDSRAARCWTVGWLFGIAWAGLLIGYLAGAGWWYLLAIITPLFALAADYAESLANHRLALRPMDNLAERRRSVYLDKLLNMRLFFLGASLIGVVFFLISLAKWLAFSVPAWEVLWLFGLAIIAVRLKASWDWSALPIAEMGNRSGGWFFNEGYANRFAIPAARQEDKEPPEVSEVRRSWKRRALLRDLVGFIPASIIAISFGWWLTLSWIFQAPATSSVKPHIWGGLNLDPRCWMPAALITAIYAISAIIGNRRRVPPVGVDSRPPASAFPTLFYVGIAGFVVAILGLAGLQVWHLLRKAVGDAAPCFSRFEWARCFRDYKFVDPRIIPGDKVLPEWLALVAAAFALYALYSATKQKRARKVADSEKRPG
jgi:Uncharacterized alpha/beta hydrolase domain (DUF2235)